MPGRGKNLLSIIYYLFTAYKPFLLSGNNKKGLYAVERI